VSAGPPPPDVPDFTGKISTVVFDQPQGSSHRTVEATVPQEGWQILVDTDFEDVNWDTKWLNISATGNWYKYGTRGIANPLDSTSKAVAWGVGTSPSSSPPLIPAVDGYPIDVDARLISREPHDFSDVIDAKLAFEYAFDADPGDKFEVGASTDNMQFKVIEQVGTVAWAKEDINLSEYAGQPNVWIVYRFTSDSTPNSGTKPGVYLDNIKLHVEYSKKTHLPVVAYGFTPTPIPPTPTPTRPPDSDYLDEFTDTIVPWQERIWTLGAIRTLFHDSSTDSKHSGFLNLSVSPKEKYVIVSPMIESKSYPYNIEVEAKIRSPREDQDQYGIIFGANYTGGDCPATDFSTCFTNYYELRVRYRDTGDRKLMEYKLKRVEGVDSNNQNFGKDLIDWTDVDEYVDEDGWVQWDVNVNSSGKIRIAADNNSVGSATDTTYLDNPYFGLEVRTGDVDSTEVRFDYFKID
jgi:hypothetical protein